MDKHKELEKVRQTVFSQPPATVEGHLGRAIVVNYIGQKLIDLEEIRVNGDTPCDDVRGFLHYAFGMSAAKLLPQGLPKESVAEAEACIRVFKTRYAPLLKTTNPSPS